METTSRLDGTQVIKVLVVDDHRTFTDLVRLALDGEADLDCLAPAHDSAEAREAVARHRPDVVIMDVNLGGEDGLELTEQLTSDYPELKVVVLTGHLTGSVMHRTAVAGAVALLPKAGSLPDLFQAVRAARHGELMVDPGLLRSLVTETQPPARPPAPPTHLTERETAVLQRLAAGVHVACISREMGISVHTCRGHVKALLSKLGAHSQLEAVAVASRQGLLDGPRIR